MGVDSQRCSKCNSVMGYLRIKTKEWVCRVCGNIEKIEITEKEVQDNGIRKKEERAV